MTPPQSSVASPNINKKPPVPQRPFSDPNHLAPEDAFYAHSSPRRQRQIDDFLSLNDDTVTADSLGVKATRLARRRRGKDRGRSGSRRGKNVWKKLLWVKQKDCKSSL
jgi:phosphatidylinositol glycan class C protein